MKEHFKDGVPAERWRWFFHPDWTNICKHLYNRITSQTDNQSQIRSTESISEWAGLRISTQKQKLMQWWSVKLHLLHGWGKCEVHGSDESSSLKTADGDATWCPQHGSCDKVWWSIAEWEERPGREIVLKGAKWDGWQTIKGPVSLSPLKQTPPELCPLTSHRYLCEPPGRKYKMLLLKMCSSAQQGWSQTLHQPTHSRVKEKSLSESLCVESWAGVNLVFIVFFGILSLSNKMFNYEASVMYPGLWAHSAGV